MEIWKNIYEYPNYEISNFGRVRNRGKKILKPNINKGYYDITLSKKGKQKHFLIHRLVWNHFGESNRIEKNLVVDHIDENKLNNHISNLQLLTNKENLNKYWDKKFCKWLFKD